MSIMSIILFIIILALLIFVHELGHFLIAKKAGVRVDEFGIGFPPRLWAKKVGETVYSINAFPVGGFVKIFGENPDEISLHGPEKGRSFARKSTWVQASVVSAGVLFNLALAWMLISAGFAFGVPYTADDSFYGTRVDNAELGIVLVEKDSPAEEVGLKSGDRIVALSGGVDTLEYPTMESTQDFIATHEKVSLSYERDGDAQTVTVSPREGLADGRRAIGISMDMIGTLNLSWYEAPIAGFVTTATLTADTVVGLFDFFKKMFVGDADFSSVSGPVGIVRIVGDASVLGLVHLISLVALISINLAVINLFPFPALDGGRLLFIIVEAIKGSPIKPVITNSVNGLGFIFLIILMVVITYSDIVKIVAG